MVRIIAAKSIPSPRRRPRKRFGYSHLRSWRRHTHGTAPYPVETVFGKRYQNVQVNIDEDMLKEIANLTGGRYYRATDDASLAHIYDEIDRLERTKIQVEEYKETAELFAPWLASALICLALEALLGLTWFRKLP
jgi:Ca-activated chloride channel family protein